MNHQPSCIGRLIIQIHSFSLVTFFNYNGKGTEKYTIFVNYLEV